MSGFGSVTGAVLTATRAYVSQGVLKQQSQTPEVFLHRLVGTLVENNGEVSKQITHGFNYPNKHLKNPVITFSSGQYCVNVRTRAIGSEDSHDQIDTKKSEINIEFDVVDRTAVHKSASDFPSLPGYVALYDHKTGLMTPVTQLERHVKFQVGDCQKEPHPSEEDIEHNYRPEVDDREDFIISLLFFDSQQQLIIPS